jgi:hypothetical protein
VVAKKDHWPMVACPRVERSVMALLIVIGSL